MPMQTWKTFLNDVGQIEDVANFRKVRGCVRIYINLLRLLGLIL